MVNLTAAQRRKLDKAEKDAYNEAIAQKEKASDAQSVEEFNKELEKARKRGASKATTKKEKFAAFSKKAIKTAKKANESYQASQESGKIKKTRKRGSTLVDSIVGTPKKKKGKKSRFDAFLE